MNIGKIEFNNVKNRFLPLPQSSSKGLEREPNIRDFNIIKELGSGSFGKVYLVTHKATKAQYAIKAIDKKNKNNIEEKPYFRREVEVMYKIHHPNVVKLYGHFEDNNFCYFIMEYIPKGNIYSLITTDKYKRISLHQAVSIIKDVISSVYFLHNMNPPIIHRDIKPENVLLTDNMMAKLTDFGWSNYIQEDVVRLTVCGTPIYLAPEIINEKGHDERVDIWCIGVLMFELVTGNVPFPGNNMEQLKRNILQLRINWPDDIQPEAKDLISKILKLNPNDRISLKEILMHPFISHFFPNAVQSLIKPDFGIDYKTFVVSKDDPETWDPINSGRLKRCYTTGNKNRINSAGKRMNSPRIPSSNNPDKFFSRKNNSPSHEIEELKRQIQRKNERIEQLKRGDGGKSYEDQLKVKCDQLEKENLSLRDKVAQYEEMIKGQHGQFIDTKLNEIRDSLTTKDTEYSYAIDNLKTHLDRETRKNLNDIIRAKEKEMEDLKKEEKAKRNAEQQKFSALLNKYDKTLSWFEKQNKELKEKIKEIENKLGK